MRGRSVGGREMALVMEMGLGREMADALWEGYTPLKTGMRTDRHTKVKTEYPPVSLRSRGGYNNL